MGTQTLTALQLPFLLWSLWVLATGILGALTLFFWIRRENLLSLDDDDLLSMVLDVSDPRSIEKEFARKVRARHLQRLLLIGSSLCFFSGSGICLTMLNFRKTPLLLSWQIPLHDLSICTAGVSVLLCVYLGCRVLLYGFHLSLQSSWFPSDQQRRERRLQRCLIACIAVGLITSSICAMLG